MKYLISEGDLEVLKLDGPNLLSLLGFEEEKEDNFSVRIWLTSKDGSEYLLTIEADQGFGVRSPKYVSLGAWLCITGIQER